MPKASVNYDQVAPTYHQRYALNALPSVAAALRSLAQAVEAERILEVGCGTGRWLVELQPTAQRMYGLDLSLGMLQQARQRTERRQAIHLTRGEAGHLPFPSATFDLLYCVNALHHFDRPQAFMAEARRLLRRGGALAVVGMDPHDARLRWYLYDYFEGTQAADLRRFPSAEKLKEWMLTAGFDRAEGRVAEWIVHAHTGRAVLDDHFLQKNSTSQLTLLSDEAYAAGRGRIEAALARAEAAGEAIQFPVNLPLVMVTGRV